MALSSIQKRSANDAMRDATRETDDAKFLEDLRGLIWNGNAAAGGWSAIGEAAGLAGSTIANFATGQTRRPSVHTIRRIALYYGYRMVFVKGQ